MNTGSKAPQIIWSEKEEFVLSGFTKSSPNLVSIQYKSLDTGATINLAPAMVEKNFQRYKPSPKQNPILQGKYECAPAALAMALGEKLFTVKRQMGKLQWRNDDSGVDDLLLRATARAMGRDLVEIPMNELSPLLGPCILTVKSLNIPKYTHALAWTGKELLDPNTHYWGVDWTPDLIEAKCCHLLLDRPLSEEENNQYMNFLKEGNEKKIPQVEYKHIVILPKFKDLEV